MWLDVGERAKLDAIASTKLTAPLDRSAFTTRAAMREESSRPAPVPLVPLPNLALRSTAVLVSLYGMVFLALLLAVEAFGAGLEVAVLSAMAVITFQYLVAPFIMI